MRRLSRHFLTGTALLLTSPFLSAAPQATSQVASETASKVSSEITLQAASQVTSQVASQAASEIASQVASEVASQVRSQIAFRLASKSSGVVPRSPWTGSGCPVSLSVWRTSPTELVNASDAVQHRGSQRIHLSVDPRDTSGIRSAELTVHATSLKGRYLLASSANASPDLDCTFQISGPSTSSLRDKDLWIDGVGSVLSVDLTSITYVDGSTWRRSPDSVCRAVPSSFLLVSSK